MAIGCKGLILTVSMQEGQMPILPASKEQNTWLICFSVKVNGAVMFIREEFVGTVREAIRYEMDLRRKLLDVGTC